MNELHTESPRSARAQNHFILEKWIGPLCLVAILIYAVSVRYALIDRPFHRDGEGVQSFFGVLARDYFRYDWRQTLGVPVMAMRWSPFKPKFYGNHPPLVPLLVAATYGAFGYRGGFDTLPPDWQMRLPAVCFTIGNIITIYVLLMRRADTQTMWITRRARTPEEAAQTGGDRAAAQGEHASSGERAWHGERTRTQSDRDGSPGGWLSDSAARFRPAVVAAAIFATFPITVYYGGHEDVVGPQLVFFCLWCLAAYERFHDRPSAGTLAMLCVAFLPAGLTDWVAFYFLPILTVHYAVTKPLKTWGRFIVFGLFGSALFFALYLQVYLVRHDLYWMREVFLRRTVADESDRGVKFTFWQWVRIAPLGWNLRKHTLIICLLAIAWACVEGWRGKSARRATRYVRLILAWAILHVLIGRQGVLNHDWWWWPLTPGLAMTAAMLIDRLCRLVEAGGLNRLPYALAAVGLLLLWEMGLIRHSDFWWIVAPGFVVLATLIAEGIRRSFDKTAPAASKSAFESSWNEADRLDPANKSADYPIRTAGQMDEPIAVDSSPPKHQPDQYLGRPHLGRPHLGRPRRVMDPSRPLDLADENAPRASLIPWTSTIVAALLIVFGAWTTAGEMHQLLTPFIYNACITQYSIVDYGAAIRAAAPPGKAVILADTEATVSLWYYGDRPLMLALYDTSLWDVPGVRRRIQNPTNTDLPFDYIEKPWPEAPVALLMPAAYAPKLKTIVANFRNNFPPLPLPDGLDQKFLAFDLRQTSLPAASTQSAGSR